MSRQKIRWGDTLDDEDALPRSSVKGPDEHGSKTIIEYYRNDKGDAIKKTTKIKVLNIEKKVYNVSTAYLPSGSLTMVAIGPGSTACFPCSARHEVDSLD
jgi:hypothetical protein